MAAENIDESFWIDSTPKTAYPPLSGDLTVDAVVLGGGIAGRPHPRSAPHIAACDRPGHGSMYP